MIEKFLYGILGLIGFFLLLAIGGMISSVFAKKPDENLGAVVARDAFRFVFLMVILIFIFVFIYPTPYKYLTYKTNTPVRFNIVTGESEMLGPADNGDMAWKPILDLK